MPDAINVVFRSQSTEFAVVTNFGMLLKPDQKTGWQFVCEEIFGLRLPDRMRIDASGKMLVPGAEGIFHSSDGCDWQRSAGALAEEPVWDIASDANDSKRIWAVGSIPRTVYLSTDGGGSFVAKHSFVEELRFTKITFAPSDSKTIYVSGYGATVGLVIAWSADGGETWTNETVAAPFTAPAQTIELVGVAPNDPRVLYLVAGLNDSEKVWKSGDRGRSASKILDLAPGELKYGFTFGATAETIFVAGRTLLETQGVAPARLYQSNDGGNTWKAPIEVGPSGPRYRCLHFRAGKLYACAGDAPSRDGFLVGASSDEGKTWTPVVRISDISGVRPCAAAPCAATAVWLCESYQIGGSMCLADGSAPGEAPDAGRDSATPAGDSGCSCAVGRRQALVAGPAIVVIVLLFGRVGLSSRRRPGRRTYPRQSARHHP